MLLTWSLLPQGHMHLIHAENKIYRIQKKKKPRSDAIDMVIIVTRPYASDSR